MSNKNYKEFKNLSAVSFEVDGGNYIYDSYSNQIMRVDQVVVDIIDDTVEMSKDDILNKYNDRYSKDVTSNAFDNILDMQKRMNVFRKFTIPKLSLSSEMKTIDKVKEKLSNKLNNLVLNVTEDCNFRCEYCIYSGNYENRRQHNKSNDLTWEVAKKAVDYFINNSKLSEFMNIGFYGGESTLRFGLIKKVVEYSKKKAPALRYSITTNGSTLTEPILDFMSKNNFQVTISLDGPRKFQDKYRKFINNKPSYDTVIGKLKLIKDKFPDLYYSNLRINAVLVPPNDDEKDIDELNRFFSNEPIFDFINKDYENLSLGIINPAKNSFVTKYNYPDFYKIFSSRMNELFIDYHINSFDISRIIVPRVLNSRLIKYIHFRSNKRMSEYEFFWPNGICIPGMRSVMVSSDGSFYPCEKIYDYGRMCIGNVYQGLDYDKIANYIDEYCKAAIHKCKNCWVFRLCGDCFFTFFGDNDSSLCHKTRMKFCASLRNLIAGYLKMYISILNKNKEAFDYLVKDATDKPEYVNTMIED